MKTLLVMLQCLCIIGITLLIPYEITQWQFWVIMVLVMAHGILFSIEQEKD